MRMIRGRGFLPYERQANDVLVVNETMARLYWPTTGALGKCVYFSHQDTCARVVGVVHDARKFRLREGETLQYFRPLSPDARDRRVLLLRFSSRSSNTGQLVRDVLNDIAPSLPYIEVRPLSSALDAQMQPWRLGASILTLFGLLAVALAAAGLFTSTAYAVQSRTKEIGVRIAIGATPRAVAMLILRSGMAPAALGVAVGGIIGLVAAPALQDLLFNVSARDPLVHGAIATLLILVACVAVVRPASQAAGIAPARALRVE